MKTNSEIIVGLNKDTKKILTDIIPCYYSNENNFVCYLFDLRNGNIKNHFYTKHKYLNISLYSSNTLERNAFKMNKNKNTSL